MENKMEEEKKIKDRKERVKNWLKNPSNLLLILILTVAFFIRLYYFILTENQPVWWDESDYMAAAKSYAGLGDYKLESIRLPTFPILASIFLRIGFTESTIRFIILFIPSILLIYLTYYLIKEMYLDKKIALISMLIFSVLWEHLFYSNRFHTENFALVFQFLALIVLIKSYAKKEDFFFIKNKYSLFLVIIFSIAAVMFRPGNIIFIPGIFIFLILMKGNILFKNKKNTRYYLSSLLMLFILFIRPGTIEYRWFFPLLPGMLVFTSKGIIDFSDFIGKKLFSKKIITFLIIIISLFGFYTQLIHADAIIKAKVDSYGQVRESGIWIKENSNSQDSIVSASVPQHSYYSERKVYDFAFNNPNQSEEYFNMKMSEIKPKYIVVSVFEPAFTPQWVYEWPSKNQDKVTPVKAYFTDSEKKQPVLVVYKFNYNYAVNT